MYSMDSIEDQLSLSRDKLVALGLFTGCDFLPKGVPGVGQAKAVKLLQHLSDSDVLKRCSTLAMLTYFSPFGIDVQIILKSIFQT